MQPEISETKKDGLQKFYNINDEDTLKFFTVHMHADKWHRKVIRNVIKKVADSKSKQDEITNSVETALGAVSSRLCEKVGTLFSTSALSLMDFTVNVEYRFWAWFS
jgi:pyrroloquinoline quinone (PQQ) biosynthesis protein C